MMQEKIEKLYEQLQSISDDLLKYQVRGNLAEIKKIIHRGQTSAPKIELDVKVGDKVRIISGPFAEFIGDITEVYPDKSKLRAMVSIFGRETPVELEYKQIQKV